MADPLRPNSPTRTRTYTGDCITDEQQGGCTCDETRLASCLAFLQEKHPDLAKVIDTWPDLPEAIQAAILAMVETSTKPKGKTARNPKE